MWWTYIERRNKDQETESKQDSTSTREWMHTKLLLTGVKEFSIVSSDRVRPAPLPITAAGHDSLATPFRRCSSCALATSRAAPTPPPPARARKIGWRWFIIPLAGSILLKRQSRIHTGSWLQFEVRTQSLNQGMNRLSSNRSRQWCRTRSLSVRVIG